MLVLRLRSQIILRDFLEAAVIFENSNDRAWRIRFDRLQLIGGALRSDASYRQWPIPFRPFHPASDKSRCTAPGSGTGQGLRTQKPEFASF
jgi:hypothetical protein